MAFLNALFKASTGPSPLAAVTSSSPSTLTLIIAEAEYLFSVEGPSPIVLKFSTSKNDLKLPNALWTINSNEASAPSNWYPTNSNPLIVLTIWFNAGSSFFISG